MFSPLLTKLMIEARSSEFRRAAARDALRQEARRRRPRTAQVTELAELDASVPAPRAASPSRRRTPLTRSI
jgi:hypothetical protein